MACKVWGDRESQLVQELWFLCKFLEFFYIFRCECDPLQAVFNQLDIVDIDVYLKLF